MIIWAIDENENVIKNFDDFDSAFEWSKNNSYDKILYKDFNGGRNHIFKQNRNVQEEK